MSPTRLKSGTVFASLCFALGFTSAVPALGAHAVIPERVFFNGDGRIPNSPLPVLLYHDVPLDGSDRAAALEKLFAGNDWPPQWRAGIFDYHHYHSNAHEVLGVAAGTARVVLGGEKGREFSLRPGDILVLPAGTGHCRIEQSDDFVVVGAYPGGQSDYDIQRADADTFQASRDRIARVALPKADPVTGRAGFLMQAWTPSDSRSQP